MIVKYLKPYLRRIFSVEWRTRIKKILNCLSLLLSLICAPFAALILAVISRKGAVMAVRNLSVGKQAAIRSAVRSVRRMDYQRHIIFLHIESEDDYLRSNNAVDKEPETVQWLEEYVHAGDVLYDIGANIGVYSLIAAKNTEGKAPIYAFEPGFPSFSQLCKNVVLNEVGNAVVPLQIALSDKTGLVDFNYRSLLTGSSLHMLGSATDRDGKRFSPVFTQLVPTYRLDDFVREFQIPRPQHIKLDVDGTEMDILRGAEEILASESLRSLILEISSDDASLIEFLGDRGLVIQSQHAHGKYVQNCVFVKRKKETSLTL